MVQPDVVWVTVPEIAERFEVKLSQVHRLIEERSLLASRIDGVVKVPELFLGETEPLRELRGTVLLLLDAGFSEAEAMTWLLEDEPSLGTSPILALRAGRKSEVRRVGQALAF
ncbi:MAG TPA: Rv2175c family DNA-binding protein [Microbacteriaceae bacterium]|nr:Rv2175c family DNA-binding protein [Microbacteriaceae bacterium]